MNFESRLKESYNNSPENSLIIAKDSGVPIGYIFSTIENVRKGDKSNIPDWAPNKDIKGFILIGIICLKKLDV